MGTVYLAEDTHLGRRVAMKFLSSPDPHYRARFLREARTVSALTHPNIAAVYDYGETEDGQPYIVMELVKGRTLGELLEDERLPLARSVEIVAEIAEALREAHEHGVVHRDVKPSNVIINERGQVKVLDFGLVKQIEEGYDADPSASTMGFSRTQSDVIVGTPLYLSPEQATGKAVDGRSDLFALGSILYECITGHSAFSGSSVIEIGAQVIHVTPAPPSKANPRVPPELDRVTMKALQKKPDSRYQSAAEMLSDLRGMRETLIAAGDDGTGPRSTSRLTAVPTNALTTLNQTLRRPRLSLATFLVGVAVVALIVWAGMRYWKPAPYKPNAVSLDWYNKGTDALRNGAFLQASKALEQSVAADDGFALAHARLAEAYTELDYLDKAKDEQLRATALVPDRSLLPRLDELYTTAITASVTRDFPGAVKAFEEISKITPNDANAYVDLGRAYEKNNEIDKAIENYVKATTLNGQSATAYLRAGVGYSFKLNVASASAAFDKADAIFKALGNPEGVAEVFRQRGVLFRGLGKFAEARAQFQQALDTARATGNEAQQVISLIELANLSFTEGNTAQAQEYAHQAVEFGRQRRLENLTTGGLIELGNSFSARGDYAEAEKYYKEAIDLARANGGRRREATAKMNLGGIYIHQLRTDEGLALEQEALSFFRQGNYPRSVLICLSFFGRAYRQKGNYDEALKTLREKLDLAKQGGDQPEIAFSYGEIGSVLADREQYVEALKQYNDSYEINKSLNNTAQLAYNLHNRGNILWRLGRADEARAALAESLKLASQPGSDYRQLRAEIELSLAQIEFSEQSLPAARSSGEQAVKLAGTQYKHVGVGAKNTLCLAKAFAGNARLGIADCESSMEIAQNAGDAGLLTRTMVAFAFAALRNGDTERALQLASEAQQRATIAGQKETLWRANLIGARANQMRGDVTVAEQLRARAESTYSDFSNSLGEFNNSYQARPDILAFRKQLDQGLP